MSLLKSVGDAFTKKNPEITVIVPESIDSSGGIKSVGTDKYKLGRVSREIKDTEKEYGLTYIPFAKLPIVFFVNKSVVIEVDRVAQENAANSEEFANASEQLNSEAEMLKEYIHELTSMIGENIYKPKHPEGC